MILLWFFHVFFKKHDFGFQTTFEELGIWAFFKKPAFAMCLELRFNFTLSKSISFFIDCVLKLKFIVFQTLSAAE